MQAKPTKFVVELQNICEKHERSKSKEKKPWILVLIDGVHTENSTVASQSSDHDINEKKQPNTNIALRDDLNTDIELVHSYLSKIASKQHSYYLGGQLFALFINDMMKQSVLIVEKLLNDLKKPIHFKVSIGMATIGCNIGKSSSDINVEELQRCWVSRAYTNLLRAKESGGDRFFNDEVCSLYYNKQ